MSSSTILAEGFNAYQCGQNINNSIHKKMQNAANEQIVFASQDYSSAYDGLIDKFSNSNSTASDGQAAGNGELTADGGTKATKEQIQQLKTAYEQVQKEQGWVGKAWNGIKNFFGHSNGSNAVLEAINKAEAGEISYEEAVEKLNTYAEKQGSVVDTFANIASGLAVAVGVIAAPVSFGASLAIGAGVGAAVKVGIKATNAATNDIEGDYNIKDGLKDGVTGAVSGVVTAATAGIGASGAVVKEGGKVLVKETVKQGAIAGAKAGAIDGAVMGATDYTADAVFDGKEFTFGGLVSNAANGAVTGAVVGGSVGGLTSGFRAYGASKVAGEAGEEAVESASKTGVKSASKVDIDTEVASFADKAKGMTTAQKREYINNLIKEGKIASEEDLLKFFGNNKGVAKTVMGSGSQYREALNEINAAGTQGTVSASATDAASQTSKQTFGQMVRSAKDNMTDLFKKGVNLKNMTPADIRQAFTGKINATKSEFKAAYEAMKQTSDYKTNLAFRTYIENALGVGLSD